MPYAGLVGCVRITVAKFENNDKQAIQFATIPREPFVPGLGLLQMTEIPPK
jgi:hypothetical protein